MSRRPGINPIQWKSGPDPVDHRLYVDCQRARAQAWYRGEDWFITEQEYIDLWRDQDRYLKKGRTRESLCLSKIDQDLAWSLENVQFITRAEHFRTCSTEHRARARSRRKNKQELSHAG